MTVGRRARRALFGGVVGLAAVALLGASGAVQAQSAPSPAGKPPAAATAAPATAATPAAAPAAPAPAVLNLAGKDVEPLREAFNAGKDQVRVLLLLSPGCQHCLDAAREVGRVLGGIEGDQVRALVVWLPLLSKDDYELAKTAASSLTDRRATHFWDPERILALEYGNSLALPQEYKYKFAVDVFLIFDPGTVWSPTGVPVPSAWLHKLGEDERKFDAGKLESELRKRLRAAPPSQGGAGF
ncbi:MAG TPA: hypothetical protein VFC23_03065 [Thermoanaerobaculia bacterium]|nr:hypothetical protein [Thermoanaerobaculia bacterium]